MSKGEHNEIVVITGASGYVATWLIHDLLDHGYKNIRGTVRNKNDERSQHLHKLPITLFEADLEKPETFEQPLNGAHVVFHIATPFQISANDPQKEIVDPAVGGTLAVLRAAKKNPTITDLIITSSSVAILSPSIGNPSEAPACPAGGYDESHWNDAADIKTPYPYSKVLAERAAWKFVEDEKPSFRLLVVNPGLIHGPLPPNFKGRLGASIEMLTRFLQPEARVPPAAPCMIDVRDLAEIHRKYYENKNAQGRLMCVNEDLSFKDMVEEAQRAFPGIGGPTNAPPPLKTNTYNHTKLYKDIPDLKLRDMKESLRDTVKSLIDNGYIKLAQPQQ